METTVKTKWVVDPTHSEISFKVKHLMITMSKECLKRSMQQHILPATIS